jgi:hypothetical protein
VRHHITPGLTSQCHPHAMPSVDLTRLVFRLRVAAWADAKDSYDKWLIKAGLTRGLTALLHKNKSRNRAPPCSSSEDTPPSEAPTPVTPPPPINTRATRGEPHRSVLVDVFSPLACPGVARQNRGLAAAREGSCPTGGSGHRGPDGD